MSIAYLYGKSGEEDQLTSDIFGLMRFLPPQLLLWPFLQKASCFCEAEARSLDAQIAFEPTRASFFFWPAARLERTATDRALVRQPDLLILLSDSTGNSAALVTEVKYEGFKHNVDARIANAGESNTGIGQIDDRSQFGESNGDQLADYWRALTESKEPAISLRTGTTRNTTVANVIEEEYRREQTRLAEVPKEKRFLLYLTGGDAPLDREMDETRAELRERWADVRSKFFWLGWSLLYEVAQVALSRVSDADRITRTIVGDILRMLDARDLRPFTGWSEAPAIAPRPDDVSFWKATWFSEPERCAEATEVSGFWREMEA